MGGSSGTMGMQRATPRLTGGAANARFPAMSGGGNAYGQQFMQQYGSPPGQMRDTGTGTMYPGGYSPGPTHMTGTGATGFSAGPMPPNTYAMSPSVYSSGPTWQNGIGQTGTSTGMPSGTSVYSSGPTWQNGLGQTGTSTGMPSGTSVMSPGTGTMYPGGYSPGPTHMFLQSSRGLLGG